LSDTMTTSALAHPPTGLTSLPTRMEPWSSSCDVSTCTDIISTSHHHTRCRHATPSDRRAHRCHGSLPHLVNHRVAVPLCIVRSRSCSGDTNREAASDTTKLRPRCTEESQSHVATIVSERQQTDKARRREQCRHCYEGVGAAAGSSSRARYTAAVSGSTHRAMPHPAPPRHSSADTHHTRHAPGVHVQATVCHMQGCRAQMPAAWGPACTASERRITSSAARQQRTAVTMTKKQTSATR
jgi:hypothetical protein